MNILDPLINEVQIYLMASLKRCLSQPMNRSGTGVGRRERKENTEFTFHSNYSQGLY